MRKDKAYLGYFPFHGDKFSDATIKNLSDGLTFRIDKPSFHIRGLFSAIRVKCITLRLTSAFGGRIDLVQASI